MSVTMLRKLAAHLGVCALATVVPLVLLTPPALAADAGVKAEILSWIQDAEDKLLELSAATPEKKFKWAPAKGVRSVGDVYMHVAAANYGLPSFLGVPPPKGFDFTTYEKSLTTKAEIRTALRDSFAHMKSVFERMSDTDIEQPAEFFGMKTTKRGAYLLLLSHAHEHLGQSIAYARMNGIVPPWTVRQEAAAKEMMEKERAK